MRRVRPPRKTHVRGLAIITATRLCAHDLDRYSPYSWWIIPAFWRQARLVCLDRAQNASWHLSLQSCLMCVDSQFLASGSDKTHSCERMHNVAIGRTLRPFPRSKRSRPVSRHSAFQLGCNTLPVRTSRCRLRGAPVGLMGAYRHLRSPLRPFACISCSLPWRTFALSGPLQPGL